jgi:GAF domain-containing protein/HAMP domain-containing protein
METQVKKPQAARSLTATLAIAFFALSVALLLASGGLQVFFNMQTQQAAISKGQQLIAQEAAQSVSRYIQDKFSILGTTVELINPATASPEQMTQALESLLGLEPAFRQLVFLNVQDQELVHASRLSQQASGGLADRLKGDPLNQIRQGQRYISPIYIDPLTSEPLVIMAVPLTNVWGDFQGTLAAEVNLKFMWDLVDQLKVEETGYAYVVDEQGNLIAFSDTARVLKGENVKQLAKVSEFVSHPTSADVTGANIYPGIKGAAVLGTYTPLEMPNWAVVTELPWQEAYQGVIRVVAVSILITLAMAVLGGVLGGYIARRLAVPLVGLTETATRITGGEMGLQAAERGPREVASLATAFNSMTGQLRELIGSLEQRVAERTKALEHQSVYLQASAEVGRAAASILEADRLIAQVVELIRERFDLYYVGLFLLDEAGEWAILRAGTGEAGRAMLSRGHRLQVGGGSMIGWSVANAQARVALEAGADAVRLATAELPETRSEAALPLRSRGRVIGALTVQSSQPGVFNPDAVAALQLMADQVAVALDNANLFSQSQAALEAVNRASAQLSRQAWVDLLKTRTDTGYRSTRYGVTGAGDFWRPEMEQAFKETRTIQADKSADGPILPLAVPIKVRGQTIGVVDTHKPSEAGDWTPEEVALLESLTEQLGVALESARLYQDTQKRATRERMIGEIASSMRKSLDMETILRTTADEIYQALELEEVTIRLVSDDDSPSAPA